MPTLENDRLVFRFPKIEKEASFSIDFQRTLRIPDSEKTYALPPGLGRFPVRHAEDYAPKLSAAMALRGGVILPMWQAEALWLRFSNTGPDWELDFPVAIKVAAGRINAVTGEQWRSGLHKEPQDYMVSPRQPWLDGFAIEPGVIRQFVAMPLGEGYAVEGQLTGEEEWGGLQIEVIPLKTHVWKEMRRKHEEQAERRRASRVLPSQHSDRLFELAPQMSVRSCAAPMGMAAGGRMKQEIYSDRFTLGDWDTAASDRVFVSLLHAKDWKATTGENAQDFPPTAKDYVRAGLPWFDYYGLDQQSLPGGQALVGIKSVATMFKENTGASLPNSEDVEIGTSHPIGPRKKRRAVRIGKW